MSMRTILILLLTVLWFLFCHYRYTCVYKDVCWGSAPKAMEKVAPIDNSTGSLSFTANKDSATTKGNFSALIDSILAGNTDDNLLEIVGYYYKGESKPAGFENMGLARADHVRSLLVGKIQDERIRIDGNIAEGELPTDSFAGIDFSWKKVDVEKSEVVKTADGAKMYFPSNSAQKVSDPQIDAYLKQVAERVKQSGEKINLIGHTDNKGSTEFNEGLGTQRANAIRDILLRNGVPRGQISVVSKGETQPVATNDSEEGRHQNRRVELNIIK
jgi:OmpA-OmpF porin, OOP family